MNKSVELLLQRMKDHPTEFLAERSSTVTDYSARESRFGHIVGSIMARKYPTGHELINGKPVKYLEFLSDEAIEQLYQGLLGICEENFYANIVDELANNNWESQRETEKLWQSHKAHAVLHAKATQAQLGLSAQNQIGASGQNGGASQGLFKTIFGGANTL